MNTHRPANDRRDSDFESIAARSNLTHSQLMIWTGQQLNPESPLYNMTLRFDLLGRIDPNRLRQAIQIVIESSDALRTVFTVIDGVPRQKVRSGWRVELPQIDLTHESNSVAACDAWITARSRRPFNLNQCTFDSALLQLAETRFVWFFNQHHLTTDAWSTSQIFTRVAAAYVALSEERSPCPPIRRFGEYADHERRNRTSKAFRHASDFWNSDSRRPIRPLTLYGCPYLGTSGATERIACSLGKTRSERLLELCKRPNVRTISDHLTRFQLFATAFAAYLARVSGQSSVVLGTPAHHRSSPAYRETIGLFMEVFPLQIEVDSNETFASLLSNVASAVQQYLRNAIPGSSNVVGTRRARVILNYIHATFGDIDEIPVNAEWVHTGYGDPRHVLRLQVHDFASRFDWQLFFDVNQDILPASIRKRISGHFLTVLDAMLANLDSCISEFPLLCGEEHERLVTQFNADRHERRAGVTVLHQFEDTAGPLDDQVAVVEGSIQWTYGQLRNRSLEFANAIRSRGAADGDRIALCMPRSGDLIAAILGIYYMGGAYVPLDPAFPDDRIAFILNDTGVRHAIATPRDVSRFAQWGCQVITSADLEQSRGPSNGMGSTSAGSIPSGAAGETDVAYVLYTSGSTGQPKGVVINHDALSEYVCWASETYVGNQRLTFPLCSPITFDLTVTSIFVPLVSGGSIRVYPDCTGPADLTIIDVIEDNAVDVIKLTPSHLSLLCNMDLTKCCVQCLIVGGEDLRADLARRVQRAFGWPVPIYNEYGPTEATVGCMIHRFDAERDTNRSVPIGRPAANRRIYLLDAHRNPIPEGLVGEIYIAGAGLAQGYVNRDDDNAHQFVEDEFNPHGRMYRTGDLARFNGREQLEFVGRTDHQIKINGVRIEPAEVESALRAHAHVDQVLVDVVQSTTRESNMTEVDYCQRCGLPANYPDVAFDGNGICNICQSLDTYRERVHSYFGTMDDLQAIFTASRKATPNASSDCLVLLSGGKDSTYALCRLVEMGLRVVAATLDNGYISNEAKGNIERTVGELNVTHHYLRTPAMNDIFVDSLKRHANVCHGCFKTIYTLALQFADKHQIPLIVTGLSRGQLFETRLTQELFTADEFDPLQIDQTVLEARKAYHRVDDAVSRLLDVKLVQNDAVFESVRFVDFYRYCDVSLDDMLSFLTSRMPWSRPQDTGRSTNCLINDAGIFVHRRKKGFHNYALPYSWDVRMGHKRRESAIEELNDEIDTQRVVTILNDIGYDEVGVLDSGPETRLAAYFTSDRRLASTELKAWLADQIPSAFVPSYFIQVPNIPLNENGKLDFRALPPPLAGGLGLDTEFRPPEGIAEQELARIWATVLRVPRVGRHDNFFDLGGDSIAAIRIVSLANVQGIALTATQLFAHQSIQQLAVVAGFDSSLQTGPSAVADGPLVDLDDRQRAQLSRLLGKKQSP